MEQRLDPLLTPLPEGADAGELFEAVAACSGDMVLLVDAAGVVRWLSPLWIRKTGWPLAQSVGRPHDQHVVPEDRHRVSLHGDPPPAHGSNRRFRLQHRQGRWVTLTSHGRFVELAGERMHLLVWRDGTALDAFADGLVALGQHRPMCEVIERLIRATEARFEDGWAWVQLVDEAGHLRVESGGHLPLAWLAAADGFAWDDPEGPSSLPCIDGEPLFVEDLGDEGCGIVQRDVALACGFRALWSAPIRGGHGGLLGAYSVLFPTPRAPGEVGQRLLSIGADLAAALIESTRARTELERAHEDLTFHVDNSPLAVVEVDRRARVLRWSSQAEQVLGWSAADVVGRSAAELDLVHEDDLDRTMQVVRGLDAGTYLRGVVRGRVRTRDGRVRDTEWHVSALRDRSGQPISFLGFGQDITERLRREVALRHTQKLESLGVLAGGIAHDFNNLLTSVMGHAGLALQSLPPDSSLARHLEPIEEAAERGAELTRQMLAYAGKGRYLVRVLDLNELVADMGDLLAVSASKKTSIRYHLGDRPLPIEGDTDQLQQVLMNLVTNASESLEDSAGLVTITTSAVELDAATIDSRYAGQEVKPGWYARLEVADTGRGMDPEILARAFDPFFTTRMTGRGLGLAAVAGIARTHRGAVRIASAPNRGTTFWVLLPLAEGAAAAVARADARSSGRRCVLVVDDEASVREVVGEILGSAGYVVLYAADGLEARSLFRERWADIDLVILDMTMPHMDGAETFKALAAIDPDVTVLLASGYAERQISQRFGRVGPAGFVQKPFRVRTLLATVETVLRQSAT